MYLPDLVCSLHLVDQLRGSLRQLVAVLYMLADVLFFQVARVQLRFR